jgi:hypothetical protein
MSLWDLPGLDKTTFYAASLYLHAARGALEGNLLRPPTRTPEATRDFLDHLADCFARSKLEDARDHVSATAMARDEKRKIITLYIAKNQSESGSKPLASGEALSEMENENRGFADDLIGKWFNDWTKHQMTQLGPKKDDRRFHIMCTFHRSRLEFYIQRLCESDTDFLDTIVSVNLAANEAYASGWKEAKKLIRDCREYKPSAGNSKALTAIAFFAGKVRKLPAVRALDDRLRVSSFGERTKLKALLDAIKWTNHLGRLWAAYVNLEEFCKHNNQRGYLFRYQLLRSQEDDWNGLDYLSKVRSWGVFLDLTQQTNLTQEKTVDELMANIVNTTGNKARVHCEMLLLLHFSRTGAEECLDYFGCSKKSCWLCWHMILKNDKQSMKGTHRKIFPRWAFPFDFVQSQPAMAEGLITASNEMLSMIQDHITKKTPLVTLESYAQTSARITPAHRRHQPLANAGREPAPSPLLANPMTIPDRLPPPLVRVPALHLPADDANGDVRMVEIDAFGANLSKLSESSIVQQTFADKEILFAFQLLTFPADLKKASDIDALRQGLWQTFHFLGISPSYACVMYYRPNQDGLDPNPSIAKIWMRLHHNLPEKFPWKGDIFIMAYQTWTPSSGFTSMAPFGNILTDSSNLDESRCFKALKQWFSGMGPEEANETARRDLEEGYRVCGLITTDLEREEHLKAIMEEHQAKYEERTARMAALDTLRSN